MNNTKYIKKPFLRYLLYFGVFTAIGLLSHMLMVSFTNYTPQRLSAITSAQVYLLVIAAFNIAGFIMLRIDELIDKHQLLFSAQTVRKWMIYIILALLLFAINYLLMAFAKYLIIGQGEIVFPYAGMRWLLIVWIIELIVMSLLLLNRSTQRSLIMQQESAQLKDAYNQARYESLQSQLNPHFLFNNLNTLLSEIAHDRDSAMEFTHRLSDVYRYVLQTQSQRLVLLSEEMAFMDNYLYLHKVRLGECLKIVNQIPRHRWNELKVTPLAIQLLIENVIKHNVVNNENNMTVNIYETGNKIAVENRLNPRISLNSSECGLKNLSNRYLLICGENIEICRDDLRQLFTVKLPLIEDHYE